MRFFFLSVYESSLLDIVLIEIFTLSVARRSEIENSPEPRGISRNTKFS